MKIPNLIIWACAGIAVVFLAASWYVTETQEEISLTMQVRIAEQEQNLTAISEITDRNGADSVAAAIIKDCSTESRQEFESLLNRLARLNTSELTKIEQLFDACASFHAERKAIMVSRMEREFEVYRDYVALYDKLDNRADVLTYPVDTWQTLVTLEKKRRDLLQEQLVIQRDIITELKGSRIINDTIQARLVRAQQITTQAGALNKEIDEVRSQLLDV